jgi:hypothetical protein
VKELPTKRHSSITFAETKTAAKIGGRGRIVLLRLGTFACTAPGKHRPPRGIESSAKTALGAPTFGPSKDSPEECEKVSTGGRHSGSASKHFSSRGDVQPISTLAFIASRKPGVTWENA